MDPEHHFACPHPLGLTLAVGRQNIAPVQFILRQEAVRRSRFRPAAACAGYACRRFLCDAIAS
ncbi:hypothetical protein CBM2633_P150007 [Cupriavidus taiwanensis]|uniref:Uncharacterized protein n=2 Tax=Cupriavidus TaxID=106589 RepID=A0A375FCE9_9BURK|nr:hypothetical protein CBM2585_P150008 [Cupriavidus taiwanensis]SOZ40433.1 hypothetical protein CBM2605_P150009 [Cupriavidus neocaledonicus]SOY74486.1 hypothetical protein CBM2588_P170007 [Cupriavidus taiwanensis]SOY74493.1 hypothetical protein CBM2592_P180008 [Cupriavidus taiwanensis]SOY75385.1 hypothetical protein CBM2589_P150008 [Cupriavidus taiwanensis]